MLVMLLYMSSADSCLWSVNNLHFFTLSNLGLQVVLVLSTFEYVSELL
jgi:hypothetical protein